MESRLIERLKAVPVEWVLGLIFLASLGLILTALGYQHIGDLRPCDLCFKQRWVYYAAIALVPLALLLFGRGRRFEMRLLLFALTAAFIANMILGGYHAGIEWKFWAGPSGCSSDTLLDPTVNLMDVLKNEKIVPCGDPQWTFLGLSMAVYSAIASLGLAILSIFASQLSYKK